MMTYQKHMILLIALLQNMEWMVRQDIYPFQMLNIKNLTGKKLKQKLIDRLKRLYLIVHKEQKKQQLRNKI